MLEFQRSKGVFPKLVDAADPCEDSKVSEGQCELEIEDHSDPAKPVKRKIRACINHFMEDTRGVNKPICSKTAPARVGMCPCCQVKSVRCKNNKSAAYVCAITHLKLTAEQR